VSDKPASEKNGNGNHTTIVSAAVKLGSKVTPQALALLLFNAGILLLLFWYIDARAKHSMVIIDQLLAACLSRQ